MFTNWAILEKTHSFWTSDFSSSVVRSKGNNMPDWSIFLVFCKCWMLLMLCQLSHLLKFLHCKQLMQERSQWLCLWQTGGLCLRKKVNYPLVMSWKNWEESGRQYKFILALGPIVAGMAEEAQIYFRVWPFSESPEDIGPPVSLSSLATSTYIYSVFPIFTSCPSVSAMKQQILPVLQYNFYFLKFC